MTFVSGRQLAVLILALVPVATGAGRSATAQAARPAAPERIVIAFGRQGGNIRPLTVTIDASGVVKASYAVAGAPAHTRLSQDTVDGLLKLATPEGFFTMPARIVGHGLPDIGGRFITIHTATATKTVSVRFVRNAAFDQLFAVLSAVTAVEA